ncbi:MAG: sigma-70 family RNA polymerase sigma factor [Gemmataceae bacterium]|nr:sigma-70 family RNA polymerase sigma factor [Gemmataceae bacterium]
MSQPPPNSVLIQACLDRIQAGDLSARDELIRQTCARLEQIARQMLRANPRIRRWEETADLTQTAVLKLYRALETVRPATASDFYRLAAFQMRQTLIDMARRHYGSHGHAAHHASAVLSDSPSAIVDRTGDSEPALLAAWGDFHEAVERLEPEERAVFELVWYHGLSQPEAADLLGIPLRTLQRRWRMARLALGSLLPVDPSDTPNP